VQVLTQVYEQVLEQVDWHVEGGAEHVVQQVGSEIHVYARGPALLQYSIS
jgi:hypothetical protein